MGHPVEDEDLMIFFYMIATVIIGFALFGCICAMFLVMVQHGVYMQDIYDGNNDIQHDVFYWGVTCIQCVALQTFVAFWLDHILFSSSYVQ